MPPPLLFFGTPGETFFFKCTCSAFRKITVTRKGFSRERLRSLTTTLSTSKGEGYEDVQSNAVDGCDRVGSSGYRQGGPGWLLRFRCLLCLLFRLQVRAAK